MSYEAVPQRLLKNAAIVIARSPQATVAISKWLLKHSEQETEKRFPCVASHSRAGGNLSESATNWMPAFASMTNPVGSRYDEALFQQPAMTTRQVNPLAISRPGTSLTAQRSEYADYLLRQRHLDKVPTLPDNIELTVMDLLNLVAIGRKIAQDHVVLTRCNFKVAHQHTTGQELG